MSAETFAAGRVHILGGAGKDDGYRLAVVIGVNKHVERAAPYLLSIIIHVILIVAIAIMPRVEALISPPEETLSVEIVTAEEFKDVSDSGKPKNDQKAIPIETSSVPVARGDTNAMPSPPQPKGPAAEPVEVEAPKWHKAVKILSAAALADPRNKRVKDTLPSLELNTRLEQLCNFEAILQIRQADSQFRPEFVVAYAMLAIKVSDNLISAEGAAFQSQGRWYNLTFKCRISPRQQKVQAFEFAIGAAIPRSEWASHYLPVSQQGSGD